MRNFQILHQKTFLDYFDDGTDSARSDWRTDWKGQVARRMYHLFFVSNPH